METQGHVSVLKPTNCAYITKLKRILGQNTHGQEENLTSICGQKILLSPVFILHHPNDGCLRMRYRQPWRWPTTLVKQWMWCQLLHGRCASWRRSKSTTHNTWRHLLRCCRTRLYISATQQLFRGYLVNFVAKLFYTSPENHSQLAINWQQNTLHEYLYEHSQVIIYSSSTK